MRERVWIVGAGFMGRAYARVMNHLGQPFLTVGRGDASAATFEQELGGAVLRGGVQTALKDVGVPELAIVAVQEDLAVAVTQQLITEGVKSLLIEKPGALTVSELETLLEMSLRSNCEVWVAYNRRFYSSVSHARRLIESDGGLLSVSFDFTEFAHVVSELNTDERTKQRWLIANSSHVIDLAFYLAGEPAEMSCFKSGGLAWHTTGCRFTGSGVTDKGVLFSYHADWAAPGRWGLELRTPQRKLLLQPLEGLKEMPRGSLSYSDVSIRDEEDRLAKPGLIQMTRAFLGGPRDDLCTLEQQVSAMYRYYEIAGYRD